MPRRPSNALPRVVIEDVQPQVDGGRHPVKRIVGDELRVEATVYKDGHDLLAAHIRYRGPGERRWRSAPMTYDRNFDRCTGTIRLDRVGRWVYTVEAWTDRLGSWVGELRKFLEAGQDVHGELLDGLALFENAGLHARGQERRVLREVALFLRRSEVPSPERAGRALDPQVLALLAEHLRPTDPIVFPEPRSVVVDRELALFGAWYEMFPRSQGPEPGKPGTFNDAVRQLPRLAELGFDVVYLPPIHPIGRTHRKGKNNSLVAGPDDPGSPWAIGNELGGHTAVEPALGTLDDFDRFVQAARDLGMEVALDYALQCSPDHPWVREHPEWFFIRPDGSIKYAENPPKKYEDIYPLNFWCDEHWALWRACRDLFRFWIGHGVRIFRVDNPHTKPFLFWEWVIAELKRECPELILLSEAFTRPARMKALAKLGFTQSYTYFTWRNTPWEVSEYATELAQSGMAEYFRPNFFTNTPDILHEYLQTGGRPAFRVRLVLAATLAPSYGIYAGFELCENLPIRPGSEEYLDSEKYEVKFRDWDAPGNLGAEIARINRIRRENPALRRLTNLEFHQSDNEQVLFYHKWVPGNDLLIAVNLDPFRVQETVVYVPVHELGLGEDQPYDIEDLLTGTRYTWRGSRNYVRLDPSVQVAHILRLERPRVGEGTP